MAIMTATLAAGERENKIRAQDSAGMWTTCHRTKCDNEINDRELLRGFDSHN